MWLRYQNALERKVLRLSPQHSKKEKRLFHLWVSDINLPQRSLKASLFFRLYLNFCYCFQCYEERECSRWSLCWRLFVLKPQVHDMRNRNINRSSAILVWLTSWLLGEYFLNEKTSWVEINHGVKELCFFFLSLLYKDKTTTN